MDLGTLLLILGFGWSFSLSAGLVMRLATRGLDDDTMLVIEAASIEATARGHRFVGVNHVVLMLLFEPEVVRRLRELGANAEDIRIALEAKLDRAERASDGAPPSISAATRRLLHQAARGRWGRVRPIELLEAVVVGPPTDARLLLEAHGITPQRFDEEAAVPAVSSTAGPYRSPSRIENDTALVLWNDDVTTMEFVFTILVEVLGKTATEARWAVLRTDRCGMARIGEYASGEAERLAGEIRRRAEAGGYPLRVTTEAG